MDESNDERKGIIRPRVNGEHMAHHVGKLVCILGSVQDVTPQGMAFKLKTSDNAVISIHLTEPLDGYLSGIIEVFGTATSKNTLLCDNIIVFPPEYTENMDLSQYNDAVNILHATDHYESLAITMN